MPDFEAMSDLEIRQYKTKLHWLRQDADRQQDLALRSEMLRAQSVIDVRQRERAAAAYLTAAETPGAVSAWIDGSAATGGAA